MGHCRAASPFPTASTTGAFWPPHCSPSSSASCSVRQKSTYQRASTSISEQTAVCFQLSASLARILTSTCPKQAVPLEDCQREYGKVIRSASPRRTKYTKPSSFAPSCTVQRPGFSTGRRSGYLSGFINAACAPSSASNGRTTRQTKKSSRKSACPASILLQVQLHWAGHVSSMEDVRMPKEVFFSELQEGKRDRGAQNKQTNKQKQKQNYKDHLKRELAQAGINDHLWQQEASGRDSWRSSVRKTGHKFEAQRHEAAKGRRRRQKERAASQSSSAPTSACPKCSRVGVSRIGLYSHQPA